MYQTKVPASHAIICTVLDKVAQGAPRPVDWRRPVYTAIDELHERAVSQDRIDIAEQISIALLKLDWAIHRKDSEAEGTIHQQLAELGESWCSMVEAAPEEVPEVAEHQRTGSMTEALERINRRSL